MHDDVKSMAVWTSHHYPCMEETIVGAKPYTSVNYPCMEETIVGAKPYTSAIESVSIVLIASCSSPEVLVLMFEVVMTSSVLLFLMKRS